MKKFAIFVCVVVNGVALAIAASVNIPYYADMPENCSFDPNIGSTNQTVPVIYFYTASTGGEIGGKFILVPGNAISFQPFKTTF